MTDINMKQIKIGRFTFYKNDKQFGVTYDHEGSRNLDKFHVSACWMWENAGPGFIFANLDRKICEVFMRGDSGFFYRKMQY